MQPGTKSALQALHAARFDVFQGQLLLFEDFNGVVRHCDSEYVHITYETDDEEYVDQVYRLSQFADGRVPKQGDYVKINVVLLQAYAPKPKDSGMLTHCSPEERKHADAKPLDGPLLF